MEMEMAEMEIRMAMEMGEALDHAKGATHNATHKQSLLGGIISAPDPVPHKESGLFHIKTHTTATSPASSPSFQRPPIRTQRPHSPLHFK